MKENFNLFDFELTQNELDVLKALDKNQNLIGCSQDTKLAEFAMTWI